MLVFLQKFFIDSLNYFFKMVSFANETLDLRKKMWIHQKKDNSRFY